MNVVVDAKAAGNIASKGTFSWGGAFGTSFWIDPEKELIGLYMIQLRNHRPMGAKREFGELVYDALVE